MAFCSLLGTLEPLLNLEFMDKREIKRLEKLVFYALAHRPDEFALFPDEEGFYSIKELAQAIAEEPGWGHVRQKTLRDLFVFWCPERFEFLEERVRARAEKDLPEPSLVDPPPVLYAVIRERAWPHVSKRGLSPAKGRFVRLYASRDLAERAKRRLGPRAIILEVQAREAAASGPPFWVLKELVYLCEWIDPQFLKGPPLTPEMLEAQRKRRQKKEKKEEKASLGPPAAHLLPGSTTLRPPVEKRKGKKKDPSWKQERRRRRRRP
ncbi:MAG TPA: hypothetical protein ENJ72_02395 [Thermodesulfatator sp.]|nr:hypothetical protein [Thermodesulfatator sp.]